MMIRMILSAWAAFLLMSADDQLRAQEPAQNSEPISRRTQDFVKVISAAEPTAIGAFWTTTGEYTRDDLSISGRENITKAFAEYFKTHQPGAVSVRDDAIRFLSKEVAIHDGTLISKQKNPVDDSLSRFSILYIKTGDTWMIGQMREIPIGPSVGELSWMVGTWKLRVGATDAVMSVRWNKSKTFMIVETTTAPTEGADIQLIGVDPSTGGLKSWSFESDGSFGTSEWVRTEKGWVATVTATTALGERVKAVTTINPTGRDTFSFRITERSVDGQAAPDVGPVTVIRMAEKR